jgi:phosphatidylserine decarboxylase
MTVRTSVLRVLAHEDINFLLTNRIPRQFLTRFIGWFSKLENPLVRSLSIGLWRFFADVDLSDAKKTHFTSMHDCFTRELKEGSRPIDTDPAVIVSPSDGIVGACGRVQAGQCIQAKGFPYTLDDLLGNKELVRKYENGVYVTLRLTSGMYHRFHAPHDCRIEKVTYVSGDTWNVNPIALRRVERLFCKNERAIIEATLKDSKHMITLVPVAAILVASILLHFLNVLLHLKYRGPNVMRCNAQFDKGEELGWFQHGSTIIVFAPAEFDLAERIREGTRVRMGEALLKVLEK